MRELITLDNVTCAYGADPVLINVSIAVAEGEFIGVVGPSGSGKSTLLKVMTSTVMPISGRVTRAGNVTVGYVPQVETVNWFFPVTVREVVLMAATGRRKPWPSKEETVLAQQTLERLGLGTLADRHIRELSGGQQQRVFIARALFKRPSVLLLDEPTSGVDVHTRHDVMHLLHDLHHDGLAIVLTTHDLNGVAAHLPRLVCLNKEVIAQGRPHDVIDPDVLERTYGAPMEVLSHGGMPVVVESSPNDDMASIPASATDTTVAVARPGHHDHGGAS